MTTATVAGSQPWYRSLDANQWKTMIASNLGWMFDGYETFALILVVGVALRDLLDPSQFAQIPAFAGTVIGITLLGWGIGGVIGGVLADYIGRRRTMILAILAYSITTGLSAFAWDWVSFALLRFLVGIAIGSEWSTGASLTAEVWPDNARGRGAGLMQCGLGIGFFLASFVWLFVSGYGPGAWRIMFLIGVIPGAVYALAAHRHPGVGEVGRSNEKRKSAHAKKKSGAALSAEDHALTRFTFADLFADPEIRRRTIIVFLMSLTTTVAWWGISTWVPPFIARHRRQGRSAGADLGELCRHELQHRRHLRLYRSRLPRRQFRPQADRDDLLRRLAGAHARCSICGPPTCIFLLLVAAINGFFTLGQYSWMSVWLPELFPTRMRATGMAFTFNARASSPFWGRCSPAC